MWTTEEAIALCRKIEKIAPSFGCHVAMTGGCLYKLGERKDLDLVFYRIRQVEKIEVAEMFDHFAVFGMQRVSGWGWLIRATYEGKPIDCFFPEELDGADYRRASEED